ncbi:MAG: ribonuclease P protein component [Oscillospiraceae bacterium]
MKFKAINKNKEFLRGYKKGQAAVDSLVVAYAIKNRFGYTRIGITASKKVGNAVKRNRARRVIRESIRHMPLDFSKGIDIILVARGKTPYVKQAAVEKQVEAQFKKMGLI